MRLAIFSPSSNEVTETFIRSHVDDLPFDVYHFYGLGVPAYLDGKEIVCYLNVVRRKWKALLVKLGVINPQDFRESTLRYLLLKFKIDICLAEYGHTGAIITPLLSRCKIPLVTHFFGYDVFRNLNGDDRVDEYRYMFSYSKYLVSVGSLMSKELVRLGASEDKIIYAPCGAQSNFLKLTSHCNTSNIVAIGRFVDKKAPHILLMAFMTVLDFNPKLRLIWVGDGELLESTRLLAKSIGIYDSIDFVGSCNHEELQKYYTDSFAFVQHSVTPSHGDMEGTPVAILEAMASGLPIVSTRHSGIQDVVIEGETGILVDELDYQKMAKAILFLDSDRPSARLMGAQGKERVMNNFMQSHHLTKLSSILEIANKNDVVV